MAGRVPRMLTIVTPLTLLASMSLVATYPQASGSESTPDALALNSVRRALTCLESRGSTSPLVAMTPERLLQFHGLLRRARQDPLCKDGRHRRFCGVGTCNTGACRCLFGFAGDRCDVYAGRCWLMHCFLRDCYSARGARLRCVCDRSLYGTRVLSGLYWYNDGLQGAYKPPPPSWVDVVPMQPDDDLEAYTMDGVDDEIDLSLYQQAVAAAVSPAKARAAAVVQNSLSRNDNSNVTTHQGGAKDISFKESTLPATYSGGAGWVRLGSSLLNKTLRALPRLEIPKIANGRGLLGHVMLMRNVSTKPAVTESPGYEREIAAKNEKSTLEKDFGGDAKFVYEDYAVFDEGAPMPSLWQSSATNIRGTTWPVWLVVACHYVRRSLEHQAL